MYDGARSVPIVCARCETEVGLLRIKIPIGEPNPYEWPVSVSLLPGYREAEPGLWCASKDAIKRYRLTGKLQPRRQSSYISAVIEGDRPNARPQEDITRAPRPVIACHNCGAKQKAGAHFVGWAVEAVAAVEAKRAKALGL